MPSADFYVAVRSPYDDLSLESGTQRRPPEVRSTAFTARPPDLPPRPLMTMDFAITCSLVRSDRPLYPALVHRAAALLHASFRPRLATTPLRFTNPLPPSSWIEDFHLQAVDHARHTWTRRRLRAIAWKQWKRGRTRFAKLRRRGAGRDLAAQTAGSPHGPWRLSNSPALAIALPNAFFTSLGLATLASKSAA